MDEEIEKYDFSNGDEFSDFKLIVENKAILIHKAVLANVSQVFRKMFLSNFKENANNQATLVGKKFDDIIELLKLIYPNYKKNINDLKKIILTTKETNAEKLLQLSDEYYITSVKALIERSLVTQLKQTESSKPMYGKAIDARIDEITYLLSLCDAYKLKKLKSECIESLSTYFSKSQLAGNTNFKNELADTTKILVYERKLDLYEEKLKQKDERLKKSQDECLKLKFELKNLERRLDTQS